MSAFKLFAECHADNLLAKTLFPDFANLVSHKDGTELAKDMETFPEDRIIGVVDNDKEMPRYFWSFALVEENVEGAIQWKKHTTREHHIFVLSPAFERWTYHVALLAAVKPVDFGLPESIKTRRELKTWKKKHLGVTIEKDEQVCTFVKTLCEQDIEPIRSIQRWFKTITKQ
jgi:hypothetical protein